MKKPVPVIKRLFKKIKYQNDCWLWQGAINNSNYGMIKDGDKMRTVHRVSYELYIGPIPHGLDVCHTCDNNNCFNPKHLEAKTNQENVKDRRKNNRPYGTPPGILRPKITCEKCGIKMSDNMMNRWHIPKCHGIK